MFNKLSIKVTVILVSVINLIFLGFACGFAVYNFNYSSNAAERVSNYDYVAASHVHEMRLAISQVWQFLTDVSATGDREGYKETEENVQVFKKSLAELKQLDPGSANQLDSLEQKFDAFHRTGQKMAEAYIIEGRESGNILMEDFDRAGDELLTSFDEIATGYQTSLNNQLSGLVENLAASKGTSIIILIAGLLFLIINSLFIYTKIVPPLGRLNSLMKDIKDGHGDLTQRIDIKTRDEIGEVIASFNGLMDDIHKIIAEVKEKAVSLADSAEQLSTSSEKVTVSSTANAASVNEIASTVENIAGNSQEISQHAGVVSEHADQGRKSIEIVSAQMSGIAAATGKVSKSIEDLSVAVNNINAFVDRVANIAEQTNLLALNAAIEAARAGEHGRGFAVVAEEVRKLAGEAAQSTKEINVLMQEVVTLSERSKQAMYEGDEAVENGNSTVGALNQSFNDILNQIHILNSQIQNIAASVQQANSGIENIAATTEEQTAGIEELSSLSVSLSQMAGDLNGLVGKFTV